MIFTFHFLFLFRYNLWKVWEKTPQAFDGGLWWYGKTCGEWNRATYAYLWSHTSTDHWRGNWLVIMYLNNKLTNYKLMIYLGNLVCGHNWQILSQNWNMSKRCFFYNKVQLFWEGQKFAQSALWFWHLLSGLLRKAEL